MTNDDDRTITRYFLDAGDFVFEDEVSTSDDGFNDPEGVTVDPATGTVSLDWGLLLLLVPGAAMFVSAAVIFRPRKTNPD